MADGQHLIYRMPWHLTPITDEARERDISGDWIVRAHIAHELELELIRLRNSLQEANYQGL
jgi:hypothetical protein